MKLSNFEDYFDDVILERGEDYFQHGHVENIEEIDLNHYMVKVEGSEDYTVKIMLDNSDTIVRTSCDCPYDWGDFCKHQAASLFALRSDTTVKTDKSKHKEKRTDLKTILSTLPKDELIGIILDISNGYREIEKKLLFTYETSTKEEISDSKKLIREYINRVKQRGFIEIRDVDEAVIGAEMTLEKARKKLEGREQERAISLCIAVLSIVVQMLDYSDDSNGVIGGVIEDSIEIIDEAVLVGMDILTESQQVKLFNTIWKESLHDRYEEWDEWRIDLWRICIYFAKKTNIRTKLENHFHRMIESTKNSWNAEYRIQRVKLLQLEIIERYDEEERASQFITANIQYPSFRKKAIEELLEQEQYHEVIHLCEEGEEANKQYIGLVYQWKKYRLQAYQGLGDIKGQRELGLEFLYHNEFQYYLHLKELYQPNEWREVQQEILETFEKQPHPLAVYLEILKVENMTDKLLRYCTKHLSSILGLYPFLVEDYPDKTNELFQEHIKTIAEQASDRRGYKNVCKIIKTYKKAFGESYAHEVIGYLKQEYKRRPAFIDELGQVK